MTTPHQQPGADIVSAIGMGAYQIGGGLYNFGQHITEDVANALINGPGVFIAHGISDIVSAVEGLAQFLMTLPLETLQRFRAFIPGAALDAFDTVASSVQTIINALDTEARMLFSVWQDFLNQVAGFVGAEVNHLLDKLVHLTPFGGFDASQLVNIANIPQLALNSIQSLEGLVRTLWDDLQSILNALNMIITSFHGGATPATGFTAIENVIQSSVSSFMASLAQAATGAVQSVETATSQTATDAISGVVQTVSGLQSQVDQLANQAQQQVTAIGNTFVDDVNRVSAAFSNLWWHF